MMKLHHQKTHAHLKSYDLYLFSPCEAVLNLSMNLNSSRRSCCGDTFFTTDMPKDPSVKLSLWHSFACMDKADFSTLSSLLKHDLWPLVRLWQGWTVRPKYVSLQSLQFHIYIMFFDLQFRNFGIFRGMPLTSKWFFELTRGHCLQPVALHFCPFCAELCFVLSCLFCTNMLPIELCFFTANIIRVFPMSSLNSVFRLFTTPLKSFNFSK